MRGIDIREAVKAAVTGPHQIGAQTILRIGQVEGFLGESEALNFVTFMSREPGTGTQAQQLGHDIEVVDMMIVLRTGGKRPGSAT